MEIHPSNKQWILAALSCATLALTSQSKAAVTVSFEQVGADVVATWNGTLDPGTFFSDQTWHSAIDYGDNAALYRITPGTPYDVWRDGLASGTGLAVSPNGGTGGTFGISFGNFYFDGLDNNIADSAIVDFGTGSDYTMTWSGNTLSGIGAASYNNTLAWTSSAGGTNTVSFTTIPEPSTAILGILGCIALVGRRRRQA